MRISDWSSDVCSSDLHALDQLGAQFLAAVIMIGDHRPLRTGMPQQFRADPAVLPRNDISIAQKLGRPGGQIRQVADRPSHALKTGIEFNTPDLKSVV